MTDLLRWLDKKFNLPLILILFLGLFWLLNGGDKFFNGKSQTSSRTTAVLIDSSGNEAFEIHPKEPSGIYGVTRDNKMIGYFERLGMPKAVALGSLYGMAVIEVILGLAFFAIFFWTLTADQSGKGEGLFNDRTIHRLAFKWSIIVFLLFSVGDILFGDRAELWEHGTFMVMCILTYDMWYRTDLYMRKKAVKEAAKEG